MNTPKVSICIPTYNQTLYLERTLNSISKQNFSDFELIISDDSTTNDVEELVEKYKITFGDKLNYFKNKPSKGTPENWNEAIRKATGAYIKIMHHDEWFINETSLGYFVETIESSKADFVFCSVHVFVESTKTEWDMKPTVSQVNEMLAIPALLILANIVGPPSSTIYKRELGLTYDNTLKFVVDFDFYIRVFQKTKNVVYI
jgi:glycosyltransferase involved in cell wall biosynthesis